MAKAKIVEPEPVIEATPYRLHLQDEIRRRPEFHAAYLRTAEDLKMAQKLIDSGDKSPPYLTRFMAESSRVWKQLFEIDNEHPRILINSCQDETRCDEWQIAREIRAKLGHEKQAAQNNLEKEQEFRNRLRARIASSSNRGQPAILEPGELPPWEADGGSLSKFFGMAGTSGDGVPVWAMRGDEILFDPRHNVAANIREYEAQWRELTKNIRLAKKNFDSIYERWADSDEVYATARQKLIDSPI